MRPCGRPLPHLGRRWLLLSCALLALGIPGLSLPARSSHAQLEGGTAHYTAGWNLVAAPTGTVLEKAAGQQFDFGPGSLDYAPVGRGEIVAGRAVWAFFPQDTELSLGPTPSEFSRTIAPPDQWIMVGNPSATKTLTISGADAALAFDGSQGYVPVTELKPGQGAWVLSHAGGDIELGKAPSGGAAETIRKLQVGLTQDAADLSSFAAMPTLADELLQARHYDEVQGALDDLRAAFRDGLRLAGSAPVGGLSKVQLDSLTGIREALARAQAATATGDLSTADGAVSEARRLGQTSEDDGAAIARARATGGDASALFAVFAADQAKPTPENLAAYGKLCLAAIPALGLALPPSPAFVDLVLATLNGTPLPAPTTATATPQPTATPVPAAPTAPPVRCAGGTLTLIPNAGLFGSNAPVTFQATGLDPGALFNLFVGTMKVVSGVADTRGSGGGTFTVPPSGPGAVMITVATFSKCGQAVFTVFIRPQTTSPTAPPKTPTPAPTGG